MKILNINKFHYIAGGAERFYFELSRLLEKKGNTVIPFAMKHEKNFKTKYDKYFVSKIQTEKSTNIWQSIRTASRFFWSCEAKRKIKKLIKKEKPEVAFLHNFYHQISPSILSVLKKNKIKTVLVAHDYGLLSPNKNMFVRGKVYDKICGHKFLRCISDRCVRNSFSASLISGLETWWHHSVLNVYRKNIDMVICPSKFMYTKFVQAGWDEKRLIHLPYFINPLNKNIKKDFNEKYVLYFGRLSTEKGIDVLINTMQHLPNVNLKIIGSGPEEEKIKLQIESYHLDNVELLGYKSGEELSSYISNSSFIVVPSKWYENYPLSILESYSLGVPALVSNMGGLPEIILNKGFLFNISNEKDLINKIEYLWKNSRVVQKEGEKVKKFVLNNNNPVEYYKTLINLVFKP